MAGRKDPPTHGSPFSALAAHAAASLAKELLLRLEPEEQRLEQFVAEKSAA
jgi:hypothetical protein